MQTSPPQPRSVAALIRAYDNPALASAIRALDACPLGAVVVVVDASRDSIGSAGAARAAAGVHPVTVVELARYGWARALNAGLDAIDRALAGALVLALSVEARPGPGDVARMASVAAGEGVSVAFARFRGRDEPTYRLPRNTCCVWNPRAFELAGRFDERLDGRGGMEDYELALRAYARAGLRPALAARNVALLSRPGVDVQAKLKREQSAVAAIEAAYPAETVAALRAEIDRGDPG